MPLTILCYLPADAPVPTPSTVKHALSGIAGLAWGRSEGSYYPL